MARAFHGSPSVLGGLFQGERRGEGSLDSVVRRPAFDGRLKCDSGVVMTSGN